MESERALRRRRLETSSTAKGYLKFTSSTDFNYFVHAPSNAGTDCETGIIVNLFPCLRAAQLTSDSATVQIKSLFFPFTAVLCFKGR